MCNNRTKIIGEFDGCALVADSLLSPCRKRAAALPVEAQIQNSKFKIQNYCSGCSLRRTLATSRSSGPPPPGGCGPHGLFKAEIQDSKFKINRECSAFSGGSLRSAGTSGYEVRAFAGRSCGPLRFLLEPQIQDSEFEIQIIARAAACGGRLRRQGAAGLRRREAAARTAFSRPKYKILNSK